MIENRDNTRNIGLEGKMKCAECTLLKAVKHVEGKYAVIHRLLPENDPNTDETQKELELQTERSFAYELYHQWSLLLKIAPESAGLSNLQLSGEVSKNLKIGPRDSYPDMVLHKNQYTTDCQLIACEIKRGIICNNARIKEDFLKLHKYLHFTDDNGNDASFQLAVFIATNCSDENLKKKIKKLLDDNLEDIDKKYHDEFDIKLKLKDVLVNDMEKIKCISAEYTSGDDNSYPVVKIFSLKDL